MKKEPTNTAEAQDQQKGQVTTTTFRCLAISNATTLNVAGGNLPNQWWNPGQNWQNGDSTSYSEKIRHSEENQYQNCHAQIWSKNNGIQLGALQGSWTSYASYPCQTPDERISTFLSYWLAWQISNKNEEYTSRTCKKECPHTPRECHHWIMPNRKKGWTKIDSAPWEFLGKMLKR